MLLPFRPKPKEDELLSSWLVRLARGCGMGIDDFLSSTDIGAYIRSFDCDRIPSDGLVNLLHGCTGADREMILRTLLIPHIRPLFSDGVQSSSVNWSWLIPLGRSGRQLAPVGFQVCPYCLCSGEPYYRWQWRIALFFRCTGHGCLLVDHCPQCASRIHPYAFSLPGLRRACGDVDGKLERCDRCSFDLRNASTNCSRASSMHTQKALQLGLAPLRH
jgi:TniQ